MSSRKTEPSPSRENRVKWVSLDNRDATASLKQHGFIQKEGDRRYTFEKYIGNVSLCGKIVVGNEDEEIEEFDKIESEPLDKDNCCKKCQRIFEHPR